MSTRVSAMAEVSKNCQYVYNKNGFSPTIAISPLSLREANSGVLPDLFVGISKGGIWGRFFILDRNNGIIKYNSGERVSGSTAEAFPVANVMRMSDNNIIFNPTITGTVTSGASGDTLPFKVTYRLFAYDGEHYTISDPITFDFPVKNPERTNDTYNNGSQYIAKILGWSDNKIWVGIGITIGRRSQNATFKQGYIYRLDYDTQTQRIANAVYVAQTPKDSTSSAAAYYEYPNFKGGCDGEKKSIIYQDCIYGYVDFKNGTGTTNYYPYKIDLTTGTATMGSAFTSDIDVAYTTEDSWEGDFLNGNNLSVIKAQTLRWFIVPYEETITTHDYGNVTGYIHYEKNIDYDNISKVMVTRLLGNYGNIIPYRNNALICERITGSSNFDSLITIVKDIQDYFADAENLDT